jgi:hypothetical protein
MNATETATPVVVSTEHSSARWTFVGLSTLVLAFLQAICPAFIAFSAVRLGVGVGAVIAAAGTDAAPTGFHQDLIRIPMMLLAFIGSGLNLLVIWHVRRLRSRPASQWRQTPVSKKKLRGERIQIALALLTFVFLASEWITHPLIHHPH